MSIVKPLGDKLVLDRPIPRNPKYGNVRSTMDTGYTVSKKKAEASQDVGRYRKIEHFKRIKPRKLFYYMSSMGAPHQEDEKTPNILLVDVRDIEEYNACHLPASVHFPKAKMNHATAPWTAPILSARNRPDWCIVVYDWDEALAPDVANIMFEKGIDNIAVLHGGAAHWLSYYDAYEGTLPEGTRVAYRSLEDATTIAPSQSVARRSVGGGGPKAPVWK